MCLFFLNFYETFLPFNAENNLEGCKFMYLDGTFDCITKDDFDSAQVILL